MSGPYGAFRVEQFGEARIVGHVAEVRIVACLEAGSRVQADGLGKVLQALTGAACQALQHGKAVPNEVELGILDGELLQVLARADEVKIRTSALYQRVPVMTTLAAAQATLRALQSLKSKALNVKSLQEYHAS